MVVTQDELGGADAHQAISGVTDFIAVPTSGAAHRAEGLSFLPQNNAEEPPVLFPDDNVEPNPALREIVPVEGPRATTSAT